MLRARCVLALGVIGAGLLSGPAHGQLPPAQGALFSVELPGGLQAALAALDDGATPDGARFLLETIRRVNSRRAGGQVGARDPALQSLLAHLKAASATTQAEPDLLPLPLAPDLWQTAVFNGRELPHGLVVAILETRNASLLYTALLALDDATRSWLGTQPDLVADLAGVHAPAFVLASPAIRVKEGVVQVPGGPSLEPLWEAFVGHPPRKAAAFVRSLLAAREGRLAYFYGSVGRLPDERLRMAFQLDAPDPAAHRAAGRQLLDAFERLAAGWRIADWPLSLPGLDPGLLAAELLADGQGRPLLPGTRRFWNQVFADQVDDDDVRAAAEGQPIEFAWLANHVFDSDAQEQRRRYHAVLFASRHLASVTAETAADAIDAVRAVIQYPALAAALDRGIGVDLSVVAQAARAAAKVSAGGDDQRAARALAQFQGALFLATRAAARGALPRAALSQVVSSIAAAPVTERGDYEGALVRALDTLVRQHAPSAFSEEGSACGTDADTPDASQLEEGLIRLASGCGRGAFPVVEWEGTWYRVDLGGAEVRRISRLLGEPRRPFIGSAWRLVRGADRLEASPLTREQLQAVAATLEQVTQAVEWETDAWPSAVSDRSRAAREQLTRSVQSRHVAEGRRAAPLLRLLADDLAARGLLELSYAAALGSPERTPIEADDVAMRHDFGRRPGLGRREEWHVPVAGTGRQRTWHVTGSLLGLDATLAPFSLVRLSSRPPSRRPTVPEELQRGLAEAIALVSPAELSDAGLQELMSALQRGRAALAGLVTPDGAGLLADAAGVGPSDRSLLAWVVTHDRERLTSFLAPGELLMLGLNRAPVPALHGWGAPARMRLGCLCLQLPTGVHWDDLAGRGVTGLQVSAFPDLNLRLAELLADVKMPPVMLTAVLGAATADLLDHAVSRDAADRRGLLDFVQALDTARVEEYLALLTSGGPLVPFEGTGTAMNEEVQ